MSLRQQAEADLAVTLEAPGDFGEPITLTDPSGFESVTQLFAAAGDIGQLVDPNTGQAVSGRHATMTLRISTIDAAGYTGLPKGIETPTSKPWLVAFSGTSTPSQRYKISESMPDRTLGIVTCVLEFYNEAAP